MRQPSGRPHGTTDWQCGIFQTCLEAGENARACTETPPRDFPQGYRLGRLRACRLRAGKAAPRNLPRGQCPLLDLDLGEPETVAKTRLGSRKFGQVLD